MKRENMVSAHNLKQQIRALENFIFNPIKSNWAVVHRVFSYDNYQAHKKSNIKENRSCCSVAFLLSRKTLTQDQDDNFACSTCPFFKFQNICCPRAGINEDRWLEAKTWEAVQENLPQIIKNCIESLGLIKTAEEGQ